MTLKRVTEMGTLTVNGTLKLAKGFARRKGQSAVQITVTMTIPEEADEGLSGYLATAQEVMDFFNFLGTHHTPFLLTIGDDE